MELHSLFWRQLKMDMLDALPELGIDSLGVTSAEPFAELKNVLIEHRRKGFESGFEHPIIEERTDPSLSLSTARSIISIAVAYPSKLKERPRSAKGNYRGQISRSAWGVDYHHVVRNRLERLDQWLRERVESLQSVHMVDTGVLVDRAVAQRSGIGWSGKNCAIISPKWGSWIYLGEIVTNLPLPSDHPIEDQCGECTLCIDACPTGALVGPGELNAQRCISYITQTKGFVDDEMKRKIGNRLYGCDTCQTVCPKNKGLNWTHHAEFEPDPELVYPELKPLMKLSNRQFREKFGVSASSWRGKNPIQRNAIIAMGNYRDQSSTTLLAELLHDDAREMIRETAAWALGRIRNPEAKEALLSAQRAEEDVRVLEAIERALQQ